MKHVNVLSTLQTLRTIIDDLPGVNSVKMASAVVYKNKIVAIGYNQLKSHPFQAEYAKNEHAIFLHSETHAINNALKRLSRKELSRSTLIIARVKKNEDMQDVFGLARPCRGCQKCIERHDIRKIIYTTSSTPKKICYTTEEYNK